LKNDVNNKTISNVHYFICMGVMAVETVGTVNTHININKMKNKEIITALELWLWKIVVPIAFIGLILLSLFK